VKPDSRVFRPEATFDPSDPQFKRRRAMGPTVRMDDPKFLKWLRDQNQVNLPSGGADDN